jgi:hypothetical protein
MLLKNIFKNLRMRLRKKAESKKDFKLNQTSMLILLPNCYS